MKPYRSMRQQGPRTDVWVRPNSYDSGLFGAAEVLSRLIGETVEAPRTVSTTVTYN